MATYLSPGVYTTETDLSTTVVSQGGNITAMVGEFNKGPAFQPKLITNVRSLEQTFGNSTDYNYVDWYTAWNILQYNQLLYVTRFVADDSVNAALGVSELETLTDIPNELRYNDDSEFSADNITFQSEETDDVILTLADASGFSVGADISSEGTGVGTITDVNGNDVTVTVSAGVFAEGEAVDDSATYTESLTTITTVETVMEQIENLRIMARYPGEYGNKLRVSMCSSDDFDTATVVGDTVFADYFSVPSIGENEIAVIVHDVDPADKENYIVKETFICSTIPGTLNYNNQNIWIGEYINRNSKLINVYTNKSEAFSIYTFNMEALVNGVDGAIDVGDITTAYDSYKNADEISIDLVVDCHNRILGEEETLATVHKYIIDNILETRKDCFGVFGIGRNQVVDNKGNEVTDSIQYKNTTLNSPSSYAALYCNWKYQYDRANDKYRWLPISGDVAGVYSVSTNMSEIWFAPAGSTRGKVKNVSKFAFVPDKPERDLLHKNNLNIVTSLPGLGSIVYSQKTLIGSESSFSDVDVRRLFTYIENSIASSSKTFLFEKNTPFTRRKLLNMIRPFLNDIVSKDGIEDFRVVCDATVNTPEVVDRNELVCDVYVKPTRSIYYIQLNFVNVKGSVSFEEIING